MMNDMETAGPALCAAAVPVMENKPAPMIAPIPIIVKLVAVRVLFKGFPSSPASCCRELSVFFTHKFAIVD